MKKRLLSILLSLVMILSALAGCLVTTNATEPTDIRDTWWADADWKKEFTDWVKNYYTVTGTSTALSTTFEIGSVPELYAFWRVSLDRESQVNYAGDGAVASGESTSGMEYTNWTSTHFTDLNTYTEVAVDSLYATRFSFVLTADLDLQGAEWPGIAEFSGNFNGQGHTISNYQTNHAVTSNSRLKHLGFFRIVSHTTSSKNLTIENLILKNASVTSNSDVSTTYIIGGLVGDYCKAAGNSANGKLTIKNVMLDGVNVTMNKNGGHTSWSYIGGLVGGVVQSGDTLVVSNCYYKGTIVVAADVAKARVGGFIGDATNGYTDSTELAPPTVTITDCVCIPTISNKAATEAQARVWCARTNGSDKNTLATGADPYGATSTSNTYAVDTSTLKTKELKVPAGRETTWYVDETYGAIPKELADNLLYKMYVQVSAVENGKYSLRIVGTVGSLEMQNITVSALSIAADKDTAEASPVADWTTHEIEPVKTVYTSIYAGEDKVTAEELGGEYVWCAVVKDLDATKPLTLRVQATKTFMDDTTQTMATYQVTVPVLTSAS